MRQDFFYLSILLLIACSFSSLLAHDNRGGVLETVDGFYHEYRSLELQPDGVIYQDRFGEKVRLAYDRLNAKTRALLYPDHLRKYAEVGWYHRHYGKPVNVVYASDTYHAKYTMLRDMVRFFLVAENH